MESQYEVKEEEKICLKCGKPMIFVKSWEIQAKSKRGPRLRISLYKCGCGPHREVEEVRN